MRLLSFMLVIILLPCGQQILAGELALAPSGYLPVKSSSEGPVNKFFVKYDIPDSLSNKLIVLAFFELETDLDTSITDKVTINVYPLTEEWTSSNLPTIKNSFQKNDTLVSYLHQKPDNEEKLRFDVTTQVTKWIKSELDNNGFMVMLRNNNTNSFDVAKTGNKLSANLRMYYETIPTDRPE